MSKTSITTHHCPQCEQDFSADLWVCPNCHAILKAPLERPGTPRWFLFIMLAVIIILLAYAAFLAYQTLVLHRF